MQLKKLFDLEKRQQNTPNMEFYTLIIQSIINIAVVTLMFGSIHLGTVYEKGSDSPHDSSRVQFIQKILEWQC